MFKLNITMPVWTYLRTTLLCTTWKSTHNHHHITTWLVSQKNHKSPVYSQ